MGDSISRQNAIEGVKELFACADIGNDEYEITYMLENLPSTDRPTGEWVWSDEDASWKCGRCDCVFEEIDWKPNYNFCPNCGAKMKGGTE